MSTPSIPALSANLLGHQHAVSRRLRKWRHQDVAGQFLSRNSHLWSTHNPPELIDRMGWLDLPLRSAQELALIEQFGEQARAEGYRHTVVLGMGGSSLAAEMFASTLPMASDCSLEVLDSTHPSVVREAAERFNPETTLFVVASKSGSTVETLSLCRYFRHWLDQAGRDPGAQLVAVTDPGTSLAELADEAEFRHLWFADPEVGGRYSALTEFGLVPAALAGIDIKQVVGSAQRARALLEGSVEEQVELLRLGVVLGELALRGVDKLTLLTGRGMTGFPVWLEQLIAESLGKRGRGIVPITDEPQASAKGYAKDRLFVSLELEDEHNGALNETLRELEATHPVARVSLPAAVDVGFEIFRWQVAAAAAGSILGVHPFNQPDVEAAKKLARKSLDGEEVEQQEQDGLWAVDLSADGFEAVATAWLKGVVMGGYVAIQAYLPVSEALNSAVRGLRGELNQLTRLATTFGYGPRFLHSTGQLHKGGPNRGLFLQLTDDASEVVPVPDSSLEFGTLIRAQAAGDAAALFERRQWVLRVAVGDDPIAAVNRMTEWLATERRG